MKIWFDFTNAPHINFFASMITELQCDHEIIITARDHSNTVALLDIAGLPYILIGKHYGKNVHEKIYGFFHRVWKLWRYLRLQKIDIAISHSSFYSPLVARLLGRPSIYLNDNEHALGNVLAFLFADRILVPETVSLAKLQRQGARASKTIQYPGVKEAIYLQPFAAGERASSPRDGLLQKIYIRPEPWNAQYYKGDQAFLDPLVKKLSEHYRVVILPRGHQQAAHYRTLQSERIAVIDGAIPLTDVYRDCALFIGAGGTMTRELAILGVPTISVYQDELLDVDRYLIKGGYMTHLLSPSLYNVEELLKRSAHTDQAILINKGNEARQLIISTLLALAVHKPNSPPEKV